MKVKVGDKIYDGEKGPVMVILSEDEKELIANMGERKKFCVFPATVDLTKNDCAKIKAWMKEELGGPDFDIKQMDKEGDYDRDSIDRMVWVVVDGSWRHVKMTKQESEAHTDSLNEKIIKNAPDYRHIL